MKEGRYDGSRYRPGETQVGEMRNGYIRWSKQSTFWEEGVEACGREFRNWGHKVVIIEVRNEERPKKREMVEQKIIPNKSKEQMHTFQADEPREELNAAYHHRSYGIPLANWNSAYLI